MKTTFLSGAQYFFLLQSDDSKRTNIANGLFYGMGRREARTQCRLVWISFVLLLFILAITVLRLSAFFIARKATGFMVIWGIMAFLSLFA